MNRLDFIDIISHGSSSESILVMLVFLENYLEREGDKNIFRPLGITKVQYNVFNVIQAFEGEVPLSHISDFLFVSSANLSGILRRMEKENYIERTISPKDRREIHVTITPLGKKKYQEARKLFVERVHTRFSKLTEQEKEKVQEALSLLYQKIL